MALLPKVKLKALVSFPANVLDGAGVDVVKENGNYRFDIAFDDFAPPVAGLSDPTNQTVLVWNSFNDTYALAPVSLFGVGGSIPEAPNNGVQYGRQSLSWTPIVASGVASGITFTPVGGIAATNVQAAIAELDAEKAPLVHTHVAANVTDFSEAVDDRVGSLLVAGTNITLSYNDVGNVLTINSTASGSGDVVGPASAVADRIAVFNGTTGKIIKDGGVTVAGLQPIDATLTALAGLDAAAGLVEQTGTDTFTKRALGVGAAASVPTRADADARYAALSHTHAQSEITNLVSDLALKAPLASPTFTGDPKSVTPATADNDTSIATTAFVQANLANYAPLASPTFTGDPKAPTPSPGDTDTSIATTAFVAAAITANIPSTITVANDVAETTAFIGFFIDASGNLQPKTNANMTFNALTGIVTFANSVLTTTDINGGTIDGTVIGASSAAAGTFALVTANSFVPNSATIPSNGTYLPAANTLGWAINSAAEMQLTATALSPAVDGGQSLGTTLLGWQNLFANTGFVLNIEAGNWVATHTSGVLTVGTGDLQITNAGTSANSVVTRTGTQTLTGKTFDANGTGNSITNIETPDIAPATLVTAAETIAANNNDTTWPTSAAVAGFAQPVDATLTALAAYNTNGLLTQTAADTFTGRTLTAPAAGFTITNPAGIAGNPTFVLADDLGALEALAGTNTIYYRSAANTWTAVTIGSNLTFTGGTLAASSGTATVGDGDYGDVVVSGTGTVWTIDTDAVTYAKMQNVSAASKLLGRGDSGSGDVQEITLGAGLAMTGTTLSSSGGAGAPAAAQYVTLALDGTLSAERVLTPGAGLTMTDGGANTTITLDVGAGTGITVNANDIALTVPVAVTSGGTGQITAPLAVGNLINACTADTTPDPAADFIGTYDASATTGKKITINDLITAAEPQIETVIDTLANLTSVQGRTLTLADAGTDAFLAWDDSASAYQNLSAADAATIISGTNTFQPLDSDLTSWALITRASGFDTFATTPTSANLAALVTNETGTGLLVFATSPQLTTPQIQDASSTNQYIFAASELAANRTVTLPLLAAGDTFVFEAHIQTLTNKTLDLTTNVLTGTRAQFNTAISDADFYTTGGTDVAVADGGTGASTLTGLLQGNGTSAITGITNSSTVGQVLRVTGASTYAWGALDLADTDAVTGTLPFANITGAQASDATLTALAGLNATAGMVVQTAADTFTKRTLTGTASEVEITNGDGVSGNPTFGLPDDVIITTSLTLANTGLHLLDTNATHDLIVKPGSDLTADRTLTITTGDANVTLNLTATTDEYVLAYDTTTNAWRGVAPTGGGGGGGFTVSSSAPGSPTSGAGWYDLTTAIAALYVDDGSSSQWVQINGIGPAGPTGPAGTVPLAYTVVALTDGATPALNASLGNIFTLSAAGNRTIAVPSSPTNGQKIVIRHLASGAIRTLALNTGAGGFRFGTDITSLTATASGKTDYIGAIYSSIDGFWDVVAYTKGF